nr:hypothetical protein BgiMline_021481 [Biomphalaria glabrata]
MSTSHIIGQTSKKLESENKNEDLNLNNKSSDEFEVPDDQNNAQSEDNENRLIGDHETQESEGGEADLHKYYIGCKKNPGHSQFIPIDTFNMKHLPEGYQDLELFEFIKAEADLTVRINVLKTSPGRPKIWPKTTRPYAFYDIRGKSNLRTGTGRVCDVYKFQDGVRQDGRVGFTDYMKCWCTQCQGSDSPSNVWWEFDVFTATHVVFDDDEATYTTLRLFYNRDDSPVVIIDKVSLESANIEYDRCLLKCVTCDQVLGSNLRKLWGHYENVWEKVLKKYTNSRNKHKLLFIVSHPHGCSKQVSVGHWKEKLEVGAKTKLTYTTSTCPGSSGAHVQCVGYFDGWSDLVHSGSFNSELNYSAPGRVYVFGS